MTISTSTADGQVRADGQAAARTAVGPASREQSRDLAAALAERPSAAPGRAAVAGARRRACTPSAAPASTAAGLRCLSPRTWTTGTS